MAVEARWPCPVCLGVRMEKTPVPGSSGLVLDDCPRCGGMWFELGEVALLRAAHAKPTWTKISLRREDPRVRCHSCGASISRADDHCVACEWKQVIDCPSCARPMSREEHAGVKLDMCGHCKGVWFDHNELAAIWNLRVDAAVQRRHLTGAAADVAAAPLHLAEVLVYAPDLAVYGAWHVAEAAVHVGAALPGAAAEAAGAAAEVAASVFETIVEIIAGLFG